MECNNGFFLHTIVTSGEKKRNFPRCESYDYGLCRQGETDSEYSKGKQRRMVFMLRLAAAHVLRHELKMMPEG